MNEHRAAAPGHARPRIVVDFDDKIVQMVRTSQVVAGCIDRASHWAIVTAVSGILTPGIIGGNTAEGEQRARRRTAVGSPPQTDQTKSTARRGAIALALIGLYAGPPKRDRNVHRADSQPALAPVSGSRPNKNVSHRYAAHGWL